MRFHLLAHDSVFHSKIILKSKGYVFINHRFLNETPCVLDVSPDSRKNAFSKCLPFCKRFFPFSRAFATEDTVVPMSIEDGHSMEMSKIHSHD